MKQPHLLALLLLFFGNIFLNGQGSFIVADTVCVGEVFSITNTSLPNQDFFWSFCERDLIDTPEVSFFEIDFLESPVFIDIQKENENFYGFATGVEGSLIRLDFGNSLSNTPTSVELSGIGEMFFGMESIQLINENNHWWGFIIGGTGNERLLRLDFGASLENIPSITNFGNIGDFAFPNEIHIEKNGDEWYAIVLNRWFGGSISVLSFGNSLVNIPTGFNIGEFGNLGAPCGFSLFQQNSNYSLFVINETSSSVSRIDFGGVFNNPPTGINLGNLGVLDVPRDISIFQQCNNFYGYILDSLDTSNTSDTLPARLIQLDFGENILSTPVANVLLEFDEWSFPHSFSSFENDDNELFLFVMDARTNMVTRLHFPKCTDASIPFYSGFQPPPISYQQAGTHLVQLIINEGTPTQSSFCKEIVVLPAPDLDLGKDTSFCIGESFILSTNNPETIWQGQEEGASFETSESGWITAQINGEECNRYDTIFVEFKDCENCLIFPNVFTPDGDNVNDFFSPFIECNIVFKKYNLQVFNRWGQQVFQTSNPQTGWDGMHKGKFAPSDVYVWKSFFSFFKNGEKIEKVEFGDVSLIR